MRDVVFICRECDLIDYGYGVGGFKCKIDNLLRKRGFDEQCEFSKKERERVRRERFSDRNDSSEKKDFQDCHSERFQSFRCCKRTRKRVNKRNKGGTRRRTNNEKRDVKHYWRFEYQTERVNCEKQKQIG
jgi:hypothetical protein